MARVIIAGDRNEQEYSFVVSAIAEALDADLVPQITEVVSGGARGVDELGELWAQRAHIPCKIFRADWEKYGRRAGPLRNRQMARFADALIAIHRNLERSRGTASMIEEARKAGLPVFIYTG